jgi:hypothetical protein
MRRMPIKMILVIAISLAIPLSAAYVSYYTVAAADFLSPNLNFEVFDQKYLESANQNELKIIDSGSFSNRFQIGAYPFGQPSYFFSNISSNDQKTIILRC